MDDAMARLDARMERLEKALERVTALIDQVNPALAMVADIADDWVESRLGGDSLEARVASIERATLTLTEPQTLDALVSIAALAPKLHGVASLVSGLDDHVAMATDIADDWVRERVGGDGLDSRMAVHPRASHAVAT